MRIKPSSKLGISGGIPLREYSQDESWNTDDQGFALSMHHQIHCLVRLAPTVQEHNGPLTCGNLGFNEARFHQG